MSNDHDPASLRAAEKVRRILRREHAKKHDRREPLLGGK